MSMAVSDPMVPATFTVGRAWKENYDTFSLELRPPVAEGFSFAPGQFNMLYMFGMGEVPISISGDPAESGKLIHTIRAVGGVTKAMSGLSKGGTIGVRGPFGTAWPVAAAEGNDVVIVAGGIGLAPIRPAIYQIMKNRAKYGKVALLYGARSPEDILFRPEIEKWRASLDMEVFVTVDRGVGDWRGNVGVVTTLIPKAGFDPHHTVAMICGPEVMMRFTVMELSKRGVPLDGIYVSMERNMKCGVGLCGYCQFGPTFICKNGPVFKYNEIKSFFGKREI